METKEVKIILDKKEKIIVLGRINMGIRMRALRESTTVRAIGKGFINEVDYPMVDALEMIYSQVNQDKLTFKQYLTVHPEEGGDELIKEYKSLNYGGATTREKFQEDSVGESNNN